MFEGLSAFPITPADESGNVDVENLQRLLARLIEAKVDSVGLLGSTGTYAFLSRTERRRAVAAASEILNGSLPLIVGVGALRTDHAIALAQDAASAGANGLIMAPMSYTPLTDEEVYEHFIAVAKATRLPLCIYNNPGTTNFTFSQELIAELAQEATIAAVKMPLTANGDFASELKELRGVVPEDFTVGYSGDWGMADALLSGAKSFHSSIAGTMPAPLVSLVQACLSGDEVKARQLNLGLKPLWDACKKHGSLRVAYAIAQEDGLTNRELPRPLLPIAGDDRKQLQIVLANLA